MDMTTKLYIFAVTHTNLMMVGLSFLLALPAVYLYWKKEPFTKVFLYCLLFMFGSVASVMLFASIEGYIGSGVWKMGNVSNYGVFLLFAPVLWLICKIFKLDVTKTFDAYAVCVAITIFFVRLNCIKVGCCKGLLIPGTSLRYPTREIEMIFFLLALIWLFKERKKSSFVMIAMCYGILRFICEFFRESGATGLFHIAHYWSIICFVVYFIIYIKQRNTTTEKRSKSK